MTLLIKLEIISIYETQADECAKLLWHVCFVLPMPVTVTVAIAVDGRVEEGL